MIFYITEKPQNQRKKHNLKGLREAKKLYNQKIKEQPDKNWLLEDENNDMILCTWDDDTEPPKTTTKNAELF